jgi:hypothetical protein
MEMTVTMTKMMTLVMLVQSQVVGPQDQWFQKVRMVAAAAGRGTKLVAAAAGGRGTKLVHKWSKRYGEVKGWINLRLQIALARAGSMCIRWTRLPWRGLGAVDGAAIPQHG